jgi:DNA modification methylase
MAVKRGHSGGKNSPKTKIKGAQNFQTTPDSTYAVCSRCHAWYGTLGLEPTPELYVQHLVAIFREIRRVLRPDGTTWLNLGDSYANIGHPKGNPGNGKAAYASQEGIHMRWEKGRGTDLKHKDIVGIPWMVAFALRADGWHLRSDVIWHKPNPMPESVTDRPTKAHEYVFLLTKSGKYFYDHDAIREPQTGNAHSRGQGLTPKTQPAGEKHIRANRTFHLSTSQYVDIPGGRNRRSVWTIPTQSYSGAHFATFPEKLVEPMLLAGTSAAGCCAACGAPYKRMTEKAFTNHDGQTKSAYPKGTTANRLALLRQAARARGQEYTNELRTIGWRPTCKCNAGEPIPCLFLDPFAGTATVGRVSLKHRRRFIGIDLKPAYLALARDRTTNVQIAIPITD